MSTQNGEPVLNPPLTLTVAFDPQTQGVMLRFDPQQVKTWEFALALLDMAKQKAEELKRLQQLQAMQSRVVEHRITEAHAFRSGRFSPPE